MIKKDTWYILSNGLHTRFRGRGKAGWESMDLPMPFPFEYSDDGTCATACTFSVDRERTADDLVACIGHRVSKVSSNGKRAAKPFKSGNAINTVKDVVVNPFTGKQAFSFVDDDSVVDCDICCPVSESP